MACINPADDAHDAEDLDGALASRFVQLSVQADRATWSAWAAGAGVHAAVVGVVERYAQALDAASPRSWTHAARIVAAHGKAGAPPDALEPLVRAVLSPVAATTLLDALEREVGGEPVTAEDMLDLPTLHAGRLRTLVTEGRLDQVVEALRRLEEAARAGAAAGRSAAIDELLDAVPPDLRAGWRERMRARGRR